MRFRQWDADFVRLVLWLNAMVTLLLSLDIVRVSLIMMSVIINRFWVRAAFFSLAVRSPYAVHEIWSDRLNGFSHDPRNGNIRKAIQLNAGPMFFGGSQRATL